MEDEINGILLKTRPEYAKTFLTNWDETKKPQIFCIFDKKPILKNNDYIFVYINRENKLGFFAKFVKSESVRGFKKLENVTTRIKERERIWNLFRDRQLHTNDKNEFDKFWEEQDGIRSFVVMTDLKKIQPIIRWQDIMKIVYTNYPRGIGYLYLGRSEVDQLMQLTKKRNDMGRN